MPKRRGLTTDEKRGRMMEFFYEKRDFFTLKELERLCHKEKDIPPMTLKDILMSLVYDGLVNTDKIGTSVYFWAFPSQAGQNRRKKIEDMECNISQLNSRLQELENMLSGAKLDKEETNERQEALSTLNSNQLLLEKLRADLTNHQRYHPNRLRELRAQTAIAIERANQWTDNVFNTIGWIKDKFGMDEASLAKQFQIPENLDYMDAGPPQ